MNILVLGSEGQIGKPFCKYAESLGHYIDRYDKKISPEFEDLSLLDSLGLERLSKRIQRSDAVLFLAFEVGGSKFLEKTDSRVTYISENVRLMDNTFMALSGSQKPFLFASSQMSNMHHTNYGFLKDLGERYTRALSGYICRFWNVYGYEDPNDPKSHVITDFIHMANTSKCITMRTTGHEERQFLHTDDCSRALLHWCLNSEVYDKSRYIDITSFEWTTILEVAHRIARQTGSIIVTGSKEDSIQKGIKNNPDDYILTKGFWRPEISLEEGINKLL